jgi:hypothetical protein
MAITGLLLLSAGWAHGFFYQHAQHHGLTLNNRFVFSASVLRHSDGAVDWGLIVWALGAPCPSFLSANAQMDTSGKS